MILWGIIVGGLLGLVSADFEQFGMILGAMVGAGAGWGLRHAVRAEVAAMLADQLAGQGAVALPVAEPVPPAHVERPRAQPNSVPVVRAETPPPAPLPEEPTGPNAFERGLAAARDWLIGGNTIVRAGLLILFVGLAFLARWAAGAGLLPIEVRLALVAAAGIALLAIGFNRRTARPAFALALQGGGIAILYLTIFAAAALYPVIPLPAAFALMVLVCMGAVALALLQDAQGLAGAAFAGGYAVPLLIGGDGPVAALLGYYTLLNLAVLALAWKKAWRSINLIGFFASFTIAGWAGAFGHGVAEYAAVQSYLLVTVLIYLAIAILYARNSDSRIGRFVDSSLLFGTGLIGFGVQAGLVADAEYGAAFAALGFAALYLLLAVAVKRRGDAGYRLLAETMLAIGIGFATLAIPLALGARWTGSAWALEGAGAYWVGRRQGRWMPRAFGLLLQAVAALMFIAMLGDTVQALPIVNPLFLTGLLVAVPVLATGWWLRETPEPGPSRFARAFAMVESGLGKPVYLIGFALWSLALIAEICRSVPAAVPGEGSVPVFSASSQQLLAMVGLTLSAWVAAQVGRRLRWDVATWPGRVTIVILFASWFAQVVGMGAHALYHPAWAAWIVAIALHVHLLWTHDRTGDALPGTALVQRIGHIGGVWLAALLIADSLWLGIDRAALWNSSWAGVVFLIASVVMLGLLTFWAGQAARGPAEARRWPLGRHLAAYHGQAALPVAVTIFLGALVAALIAEGSAAPLPYVPLLNPVELTLALALAVLVLWRRSLIAVAPYRGTGWVGARGPWLALVALGFVIVNMAWLRFAHHYLDIAWDGDALLGAPVVQAGLSILWALLALGLMLFGHRRAQRVVWVVGAALLAVVVLKLFFADLSRASGGARIVTFIVVGGLMLVVGYFAPLPPRTGEEKEEKAA